MYENRPLWDWVNDYYVDSRTDMKNDSPHTDAYFAIRAIGTNALPTLLHWVAIQQSPDTPWQVNLARRLPDAIAESGFVRRWMDYYLPPNYPYQVFLILGTNANGAVPELTRMMRDPRSPDHGFSAAFALANIEPEGFAPLAAAAKDPQAPCRREVIEALSGMVANKSASLRLLQELTHDPDPDVSAAARRALENAVPGQSQSVNP
jgi:hypothetical protein